METKPRMNRASTNYDMILSRVIAETEKAVPGSTQNAGLELEGSEIDALIASWEAGE